MMRAFALGITLALAAGFWVSSAVASTADKAAGDKAAGPWGTVKGRVVWGPDEVPPRKPVTVNKDQEHCLAEGPILEDDLVVNPKDRGVKWVFVWLTPEPGAKRLPVHPSLEKVKDKDVEIDQPHCMFKPHALGMREGQNLVAKNSATIAHNVNWTGGLKNPGNNVIVAPKQSYTITDLAADRFPVKVTCNIHPWMSAWVRVYDHPYFAVTDADGNFEFKLAPAGTYRLMVWQETIGYRGGAAGRNGTPVNIRAGEVTDLGKLDLKP
jgi:hypothetical protein